MDWETYMHRIGRAGRFGQCSFLLKLYHVSCVCVCDVCDAVFIIRNILPNTICGMPNTVKVQTDAQRPLFWYLKSGSFICVCEVFSGFGCFYCKYIIILIRKIRLKGTVKSCLLSEI